MMMGVSIYLQQRTGRYQVLTVVYCVQDKERAACLVDGVLRAIFYYYSTVGRHIYADSNSKIAAQQHGWVCMKSLLHRYMHASILGTGTYCTTPSYLLHGSTTAFYRRVLEY